MTNSLHRKCSNEFSSHMSRIKWSKSKCVNSIIMNILTDFCSIESFKVLVYQYTSGLTLYKMMLNYQLIQFFLINWWLKLIIIYNLNEFNKYYRNVGIGVEVVLELLTIKLYIFNKIV